MAASRSLLFYLLRHLSYIPKHFRRLSPAFDYDRAHVKEVRPYDYPGWGQDFVREDTTRSACYSEAQVYKHDQGSAIELDGEAERGRDGDRMRC